MEYLNNSIFTNTFFPKRNCSKKKKYTEHFSLQLELATSRVISAFRRKVPANYTLLGYYAASSGNFLPTFRDNLSVPAVGFKNRKERFLNLTAGTDMLSRNVGKKLPVLAA
jgi:hypothetical protein